MLSLVEKKRVIQVISESIVNYTTIETIKNELEEVKNKLGEKIYIGEYKGRGKNTTYQLNKTIDILKNILEVYKAGNDAPRGGKIGGYVIFNNTAHNRRVLKIVNDFLNVLKYN